MKSKIITLFLGLILFSSCKYTQNKNSNDPINMEEQNEPEKDYEQELTKAIGKGFHKIDLLEFSSLILEPWPWIISVGETPHFPLGKKLEEFKLERGIGAFSMLHLVLNTKTDSLNIIGELRANGLTEPVFQANDDLILWQKTYKLGNLGKEPGFWVMNEDGIQLFFPSSGKSFQEIQTQLEPFISSKMSE
jgi:hypothetical protein